MNQREKPGFGLEPITPQVLGGRWCLELGGGGVMVCAADVIFSEQTFRTCASLDGAWTSSIWGLQTRSAKNRIRALITSPGELHADRSWERIITTETEENF